MRRTISPAEANRMFSVNMPGQLQAIYEPLYDFQTYPAAGAQSLRFFQEPVGGPSGKTKEDTNMRAGGALPAPQHFLATSIQVEYYPAEDPMSAGVAPGTVSTFTNDTYNVLKAGSLSFVVGDKPQLRQGPLMIFPPKHRLYAEGAIADSTTAGATQKTTLDYACAVGECFEIEPTLIPPNQNFDVTIEFPSAVVPVASDARIGVRINGTLYRAVM